MGLPRDLIEDAEGFGDMLIYPDNWPAVALFRDMGTQWRVSTGGLVGLDYSALPAVMRIRSVPRKEMSEIFDGIKIMEAAALEHMRNT